MGFRERLKEIMQTIAQSTAALIQVPGVGGLVIGVVYKATDESEATDEVALLVMPKTPDAEEHVRQCVAEGLIHAGHQFSKEKFHVGGQSDGVSN